MKRIFLIAVLVIAILALVVPAVATPASAVNTYYKSCKAINPAAKVVDVGPKFSGGTAQAKICLLKTSTYNVVLGARIHSTVQTNKRYNIHGRITPAHSVEGRTNGFLALELPANRWAFNNRLFAAIGYRPSRVNLGIVILLPDGELYALSDRSRGLS